MRHFALGLALLVLLAGCGNGGKQKQSPTLPNTSSTSQSTGSSTGTTPPEAQTTTSAASSGKVVTHGRFHYPQVLITNYMKSCVRSAGTAAGNTRDYCACTLDKLSNNVSTRDFAEIGLSHGHIPPRIKRFMSQAVADCAGKL